MASASIIEGIGNDVLFIFTAFSLTVCVVVTYYVKLAVRTIGNPPRRENAPGSQETSAVPSEGQSNDSFRASGASSNANERGTETSNTASSNFASPGPQEATVAGPAARRSSDSDIPRRDPRVSEDTQDTHSEGLRWRGEERQSSDASTEDGQITIRVKFMENDRSFTVNPNITVGQLKRTCFPEEVQQGRRVRLIYSGRLLQDDSASLSFYGVSNFSVIHTQISEAGQPQQQQAYTDEGDLDLSRMFIPLVTSILCFSWFGVAYYSHLFTTISTVILIIVTAVYAFILFVMTS